ncbi:MAG: twin-arginine translocase TatA/TatE family subunit [Armatimonadota bacterium]
MELFAFLGTQEIVVVLVLALIVFGPQKLPEIGRQVGSAMRELRKMTGDVQRALDFDDHIGSSVNAYDSSHWYDSVESPAIAAPQGATVAQSSTQGMLASSESSYEVASEGAEGFVSPPGPPARSLSEPAAKQENAQEL